MEIWYDCKQRRNGYILRPRQSLTKQAHEVQKEQSSGQNYSKNCNFLKFDNKFYLCLVKNSKLSRSLSKIQHKKQIYFFVGFSSSKSNNFYSSCNWSFKTSPPPEWPDRPVRPWSQVSTTCYHNSEDCTLHPEHLEGRQGNNFPLRIKLISLEAKETLESSFCYIMIEYIGLKRNTLKQRLHFHCEHSQ